MPETAIVAVCLPGSVVEDEGKELLNFSKAYAIIFPFSVFNFPLFSMFSHS